MPCKVKTDGIEDPVVRRRDLASYLFLKWLRFCTEPFMLIIPSYNTKYISEVWLVRGDDNNKSK